MPDTREAALRLIELLDLTSTEPTCGPAEIKALCARAEGPPARVAAVCVWPQFVGECRRALKESGVRVATVINFPNGGGDIERTIEDAEEALGDGADEIDLMLPHSALLGGELAAA